jgi:hypothetical protein
MRIFVTDHNTSLEVGVQRTLGILREAGIDSDGGGIFDDQSAIAP